MGLQELRNRTPSRLRQAVVKVWANNVDNGRVRSCLEAIDRIARRVEYLSSEDLVTVAALRVEREFEVGRNKAGVQVVVNVKRLSGVSVDVLLAVRATGHG